MKKFGDGDFVLSIHCMYIEDGIQHEMQIPVLTCSWTPVIQDLSIYHPG